MNGLVEVVVANGVRVSLLISSASTSNVLRLTGLRTGNRFCHLFPRQVFEIYEGRRMTASVESIA